MHTEEPKVSYDLALQLGLNQFPIKEDGLFYAPPRYMYIDGVYAPTLNHLIEVIGEEEVKSAVERGEIEAVTPDNLARHWLSKNTK